jgi:hypothetical protein
VIVVAGLAPWPSGDQAISPAAAAANEPPTASVSKNSLPRRRVGSLARDASTSPSVSGSSVSPQASATAATSTKALSAAPPRTLTAPRHIPSKGEAPGAKVETLLSSGVFHCGLLKVQVVYGGGLGGLLGGVGRTLGLSDVGYMTADDGWQPSTPFLMLGGTLPLFTQYVQFRFVAADSSGQFRIDDVYLDPLMHR